MKSPQPYLHLAHANECHTALERQYKTALQEVDDAFTQGQKRRAERCLRRAFDLSVRLLDGGVEISDAIQRVLEATRYCVDFFPTPDEDSEHYPLEIVAGSFEKVVTDPQHPNWLRAEALIAYAEIAPFAEQLSKLRQSKRATQVLTKFQDLWERYWLELCRADEH